MNSIRITVNGRPAALADGQNWEPKPPAKATLLPVWHTSCFAVLIINLPVAAGFTQATVGLPAQWHNGQSRAWPKPHPSLGDQAQAG